MCPHVGRDLEGGMAKLGIFCYVAKHVPAKHINKLRGCGATGTTRRCITRRNKLRGCRVTGTTKRCMTKHSILRGCRATGTTKNNRHHQTLFKQGSGHWLAAQPPQNMKSRTPRQRWLASCTPHQVTNDSLHLYIYIYTPTPHRCPA